MKQAATPKTTQQPSGTKELPLGRLTLDLLDVTWRIAVPVVLLAGLGLAADKSLGWTPGLTLTGMVAGFGIAYLLVKKQLALVATGVKS